MKNFGSKPWLLPQPVPIIGTYDKDGKLHEIETGYYLIAEVIDIQCDEKYLAADGQPDVERMQIITYDPVHHGYIELGKAVGKAFADGKKLK